MCRYLLTLVFLAALASETRACEVSARAYVLMEAESGRVLCSSNAHEALPIASITKLMTALTAIESGRDLKSVYKIPKEWTGAEGSSVYLRPGEEISLEFLLYGMLLHSGNDAAVAVAGICGATPQRFTALMNQKAAELGMNDSRFENPNGLHSDGHYSSAYDMALLARACLQNETLARIVSTRSITLGGRTYTNHNKLLWRYPGCIGLKTGYTEAAGRTLVSAARRDGVTLICVTLNDPDDWHDHTVLLDEGFRSCERVVLCRKGEVICRIPVSGSLVPFAAAAAETEVSAVLPKGSNPDETCELNCEVCAAPAAAGEMLGRISYDTGECGSVSAKLVAAEPVPFDLWQPPVRRMLQFWKTERDKGVPRWTSVFKK